MGPLRGISQEFFSFFYSPNPHWFLQPEVMGTYLPGTGTLGWVVWCRSGIPHSQRIPPNFYPPHVDMGLPVPCLCVFMSAPLLANLDEYDFFNSLVVELPYSLIFLMILGDSCFVF